MFHPGSLVVIAAVLLLGTGALAQGARQWRRVERSVTLGAGDEAATHPLRLAPNVVTTVLFDSDVTLEEADVAALRPLFTRLEVQARLLVFKPAISMPEQGLPPLVVRFADTAAPQRLVLVLSTDGKEVDSVLDVLRQPATAEQLQAQLVTLRERCEALEERLAASRRPVLSRGLAGALLSGAIEEDGVKGIAVKGGPANNGLWAWDLSAYRSGRWRAFLMELENPPGAAPWGPGVARLTRLDAEGRPVGAVLEAPVLLRDARLAPGQRARAVAQWELPEDAEAAVYALEVVKAAGRRGIRWPRVEL
ncbi:MAG TPA: DUF2381 family protein [Myxococcus sp.]|nr:DUF2381 family protein [Myxococcus sp.]